MTIPLVLASGSSIRRTLLENAGLTFAIDVPRIDEDTVKQALLAEDATPRDIADALAEMKAKRISDRHPEAMVLGCDQVLAFNGQLLSKPLSKADALAQLKAMRNAQHLLLSAAVIYQAGQPLWRNVGQVRMRMRDCSTPFLEGYVERNWDSIRHAVGGYKLEEEGVRLFSSINGDYFHVLGLPLLEVLAFLGQHEVIET